MKKEIKNIYMIGICGVAMGSLAGMLKQSGYDVSGSDDNVYPPMSDMLGEWGIKACSGFNASNIKDPDLVIVGNAISRGNVEAEHVLNKRIPYCSMAQALHDFFLEGREVVAVTGTHGKTTTTALLAHILETAGMSPSFFVGGVPINYNSNFRLGSGRYFIIEGDEYDSAFFEKVPKFILYRPHHLVITSLEFDHADIYKNIQDIELWFRRLVNMVPSNGHIVYSGQYKALNDITEKSRSSCQSFGASGADFSYSVTADSGDFSELTVSGKDGRSIALKTRLFGEFNYANIAAAVSMSLLLGVDAGKIQKAVFTFDGVKRRQELIYNRRNIKIFEDFAHHPTAIGFVLGMLKKRFPGARLWAVYEPRSATSRRNVFQDELPAAFEKADAIFIKSPYMPEKIPEGERMDISRVVRELSDMGKDANLIDGVDEIVRMIFKSMDFSRENVVLIMSNGGFDGIYEKMISEADRCNNCTGVET